MPPESQVDAPLILASLIILGILGCSLTLWIRHIQKPRDTINESPGIPAWSIGWVNFGIFICAMVIAVFMAQNIGVALFFEASSEGEAPRELTPWIAVLAVLLLQLPMLATFYGARRFYPGHYASELNVSTLSAVTALRQALPYFLMYLPVIWIVTLLWTSLLNALEAAGAIESFAPQELITLFQAGGSPLAIGILVIMAIVLAPIVEEIIFRGCIYRFLKSQTTRLPAQILSSCIFSMMHANLMSFVPLVIVGIVLARLYEKSGNLMVSISFHAFFNAFSLCMLFITSMSQAIPQ
ncbi:CPBP family intramembrane metalloprotease [Coraliomargarita sp. SDUM461004]|uniref:CPBP family intramembrane metalloprotease n=1 Tax=Thalassobacterium sedimentorum TaxID=3041258 RepID=A0ABU1AK35_9BACT|nr:CPBP family intramembrane glutamic endopeptidase [Coraliomargarita sp. SDUM461004]MDQ8195177.1 CPBP family intramembrane metalloprotease [Coraliomargarita sp. SDUM461004]